MADKSSLPAFGCAQHLKTGQNTQHIFVSLSSVCVCVCVCARERDIERLKRCQNLKDSLTIFSTHN